MGTQKLMRHGLSIDVEDWFHILDYRQAPSAKNWNRLYPRVSYNIKFILDLLNHHNIKATFFILGWIAERHPDLVQQICDQGHELGSHGHLHTMTSHLSPAEFAKDLDHSLTAISQASKKDVIAYRAPGFSIDYEQFWIFEILASRGIKFDSSLFLGPHCHGGISLQRSAPFEIILPNRGNIIEFPIIPFTFLNQQIPFSGGGYLRLFPTIFIKQIFKLSEERNSTIIVYVHPRDFDPYQPRMHLAPITYFRYYIGLNDFAGKFNEILRSFEFDSLGSILNDIALDDCLCVEQRLSTKERFSGLFF